MENELGIFGAAIDTLKTIADAINGVVTERAIVNSHEESAHSIDEYIHEILGGWVIDNLTSMFSFVNEAMGIITDEAAKTPETWNSDIFTMIQSIFHKMMTIECPNCKFVWLYMGR